MPAVFLELKTQAYAYHAEMTVPHISLRAGAAAVKYTHSSENCFT